MLVTLPGFADIKTCFKNKVYIPAVFTLHEWYIPMQEKKLKRDFDRSSSTAKNIRFEDELLEQINNAAGPGQFSSWVKEACREKLRKLGIVPKG